MGKRSDSFEPFGFANTNKPWVVKEFTALLTEWSMWNDVVQTLPDSPDYKTQTCAESIKDGYDNLNKHEILREKTLVFLRNNFVGSEFIFENWPSHPHEDVTSRLRRRVPNWIHRLEILKASIAYANVPDGFWKEKGKELVSAIAGRTPEKAVEIAASYLKSPLSE